MNIQEILYKIKEKRHTDKEVAAFVGVTPNTVTRLRNKVHNSTRYEFAEKIKEFARLHGIEVK